jgi:hypothetical protein
MSLPEGLSTVLVTVGPYLDHEGTPLKGTVTFTPSASPLVHAASGTALIRSAVTIELGRGKGEVVLPATDQTGIVSGSTSIRNWTYEVTFRFRNAVSPAPVNIALPAAQSAVDLDLLVPTEGSTGVIVARPAVTSVNGQTGNVVIALPVVAPPLHIDPTSAPYGAKGDGVTDDTVAIQKALDAAMAVSGSSVEFPAGVFVVSSVGLDYSLAKWPVQAESGEPYGYSSPIVTGQGSKKTQFKQKAGSTGDVFVVSGKIGTDSGPANNNKATGAVLQDFEIVGTSTGRHGLRLRSLVNTNYSRLAIRNCGGNGIYFERETFVSGTDDEYSYSNSFHDIKVTSNKGWGIACSGAASIGGSFYDVEAIGNTLGGWLLNPTNMALHGCNAIGNGTGNVNARGLLAVRNTNTNSVNSTLILDGFRSEENSTVGGYEVEIAAGIGYEINAPAFYANSGAHCLGIGLRALGSVGYVQSLTVTGGYYGTATNTYSTQRAIVLGSDARDTVIKGGRYNFQTLNTVEQLVTDNGFRTSIEHPSMHRFGSNGVLSLMRSLTTAPGSKGGEAQIFQRLNANSKMELCVKMPTGVPLVLATEA